ncbi:MAG: RNase adapter RapZ [Atopobiaceae bacterium]|nr:RNase adapter RapZ [Atopobiaceae bacterium]
MQDGPHIQESALKSPDVIVITGMSGAGRTEAMHTFEDLGYYVIDNLPPSLILAVAQMGGLSSGIGRHLAVVCDLRSQEFFTELHDALEQLANHEYSYGVLFLDASDETLLRRYALNRRPHPIAREGETTIDAIRRERRNLAEMQKHVTLTIDTTNLKPKQLRSRLLQEFTHLTEQQLMEVHVFSFGFKYGMPEEADIIIDVRFLPNPYWNPEMRPLTGRDPLVRDFVIEHPQTKTFLERWIALLDAVMPGYVAEGKSRLSVGVGCSGGQHRSVAIAEETASHLLAEGYHVLTSHRDLARAEHQAAER